MSIILQAGGQQRGTGQPNIQSEHQNKNGHMISNIMALDSLSSRLPPPSPAPENPPSHLLSPSSPEDPHSVAAAIKDIRKAIQSAKTLHPTHGCVTGTGNDPWLPRGGERVEPPLPAPLPPTSCPPTPPSPACSTPPPPPPVELHEETESELEEERVPTPEIMKKEDEDLDTDQVTYGTFYWQIKLCIIAANFVEVDLQLNNKKTFYCTLSCFVPGGPGLFVRSC